MSNFADVVTTDPVINAESRVPMVIAVCTIFSFISVSAVSLRLYTRMHILHHAGADDVSIVIAEVLALLTALGAGMEARHGLGKHTWTVSSEDALAQLRWLYVVIIFYNLSTNVIKLSFLLQFRRLFAGEWTLRICKWFIVFICIWSVVQVVILSTACLPLASIVPSMAGKCLPATPVWFFTSAMNIATDFAIFLIPLPAIWGLKMMKKKQKIGLFIIFCLGFFTCIISIIRIFTLTQRTKSKDIFWTGVSPACWSLVEIHIGILASCLATLRPFLRHVFPSLADTETGASGPYEMNKAPRSAAFSHSHSRYKSGSACKSISGYKSTLVGGGSAVTATADVKPRPPSTGSAEGLKENAAEYTDEYTVEFPPRLDGAGHVAKIYSGKDGESSCEGLEERVEQAQEGKGDSLQIYKHQTFEAKLSGA